MRVSVTYTPAEFESRDTSGATVVVIDCFRASTSIVAALAAGARAVYPYLAVEEAREAARGREGAVLAGERGGARIEGFDLGNSPGEFTRSAVGGRDVMMTTTNGTRMLVAATRAEAVYVGAFVNAAATARSAAAEGRDIVLAAAGTEGEFSIEDALCAGMMAGRILAEGGGKGDDSAQFAILAYEKAKGGLRQAALGGKGAANVIALGLEKDLDACMAVDSIAAAAKVWREPLRVVKA
jgi:2-phosphosulfolactate phosphatase